MISYMSDTLAKRLKAAGMTGPNCNKRYDQSSERRNFQAGHLGRRCAGRTEGRRAIDEQTGAMSASECNGGYPRRSGVRPSLHPIVQ